MKLKWHPLAIEDVHQIVNYVKENFGATVALSVKNKINGSAKILKSNPLLGPTEPLLKDCTSLEYRSLVATAYTKIIYTVHDDYVYIHLLWDVRQDVERISKVVTSRYTLFNQEYCNTVNEPPVAYGKSVEESK